MKSNKVLFFLPEETLNEATEYYVDIIKEAISKSGCEVVQSSQFKDTKHFKTVLVMSAKWCFLVKATNPKAKVITWFQGLGGEEALLSRGSKRDKAIWTLLEGFAMKFSWLNIYVSERMRQYYTSRFKTSDENYFIMPCFNKELNEEAFHYPDKYTTPTFVYAGGLDKWQCIEQTLELYSLIEKSIPDASITLLTKQKEQANELLEKHNIKNGRVDFVSLDRLDSELQKYKYGFIIREDHIVNNVSTPTKMNSYLANGLIPIYTNVVDSFNIYLNNKYFINLSYDEDFTSWAKVIIDNESNNDLDKTDYIESLEELFSDYYSKDFYLNSFLNKKYFK